MSTHAIAPVEHDIDDKSLLSLVTDGDASKLNDAQKLAYYKARCEVAGLDYRAQPFAYIRLNGKLTLYALKACTDQLAAKHGIRCEILSQVTEEGIRVVTVRATAADGRQTDEIGAVAVKGLSGEALCNAYMKCATKAKRRATLAICGLGMLDETELDTIPSAKPEPTIQMPRRLSEARRNDADGPNPSLVLGSTPVDSDRVHAVGHSRHVDAEVVVDPEHEDTIQTALKASIAVNEAAEQGVIDEGQRRRLFALMREGGHSKESVSAWLLREHGISSSKNIPVGRYAAIAERLKSQEPLA